MSAELKSMCRQILDVPSSALVAKSNCPKCGDVLRHLYWFAHPEMQALARGYLLNLNTIEKGLASLEYVIKELAHARLTVGDALVAKASLLQLREGVS